MRKSLMALMAVVMVFAASLAAEAGTINIKNAVGEEIYRIYISASGTDDWEEDVLGDNVLENGQTLRLSVNGSYTKFDLRAEDEAGNSVSWYELPGNATSITLKSDGTAEYQ